MTGQQNKILENISSRKFTKFLKNHVNSIKEIVTQNQIVLYIYKKYAYDVLKKKRNLKKIQEKITKIYGENFSLKLKLKPNFILHDREMNIPKVIHY